MVNGYLELDGKIFKISSEDDLKDFISRMGKVMDELSEKQYEEMCDNKSKSYVVDDCSIRYSEDGLRLLFGVNNSSKIYSVKDGVIFVCDFAFNWKYNYNYDKDYYVPVYSMHNRYRSKLNKLYFPESVQGIGRGAFSFNQTLIEVLLSNNIEYLGAGSFIGCSNISVFNLPSHLKYIGDDAFCDCEKITFEMQFPKHLKSIGARAFQGCKSITKIVLPNSLKEIGSHAFKDCDNLESIYMPDSIEQIGSGGIFEGCNKLTTIYIPVGSEDKFNEMIPFYKHLFIKTNDIQ